MSVLMIAALARAEIDPVPLLQQALRVGVTIHTNTRTGFMVPAAHCRRASEGCDRRLLEFAHYLNDAGERYGVDPWLLAAMAFRESGLNPFVVGPVGELGILQLHPKNPRSKHVRFVHDPWYRSRCRHEAGACQREVVERAAAILAVSLEKCGGDLNKALGMYNSGRCTAHNAYARRVLREREKLKSAVGLQIEVDDDNAASARAEQQPASNRNAALVGAAPADDGSEGHGAPELIETASAR